MANLPPLPEHATHWAINRDTGMQLAVCFVDGVMYYHTDIYSPLQELSPQEWYVKTDYKTHIILIIISIIGIVAASCFL